MCESIVRLLDDYGETFHSGVSPFPAGTPSKTILVKPPSSSSGFHRPRLKPQAGLALTLPSFKSIHSLLFLSTAAMIGMMIMVVKMIDFGVNDNDDDMI